MHVRIRLGARQACLRRRSDTRDLLFPNRGPLKGGVWWYGNPYSFLVFGKVKIWGEVVEHERGYRSEFARIVSLDHGDPELLARFRSIYGMAGPTLNLS